MVQLWYTSGTLSPGIRCLVPGRGRVGFTGWSGAVHLLVTCWLGHGLLAGRGVVDEREGRGGHEAGNDGGLFGED
ncbi:MAG: hypothetical protein SOY65_04250 [Marinifilaceae bacterium]|nr:hypothetical protein [Marinifilaceae bacterium]